MSFSVFSIWISELIVLDSSLVVCSANVVSLLSYFKISITLINSIKAILVDLTKLIVLYNNSQ